MKRSLGFWVKGTEEVPCPCCTERLEIIGSRERKVRGEGGELRRLVIRRLRCTGCRKIHHELPDLLVPYKRYESACIEQTVTEPEASVTVCAETSTLRRWRLGFRLWLHSPAALPLPSVSIEAFRYEGPGWLARIVRSVANAQLWLHTRFAYLSAPALR